MFFFFLSIHVSDRPTAVWRIAIHKHALETLSIFPLVYLDGSEIFEPSLWKLLGTYDGPKWGQILTSKYTCRSSPWCWMDTNRDLSKYWKSPADCTGGTGWWFWVCPACITFLVTSGPSETDPFWLNFQGRAHSFGLDRESWSQEPRQYSLDCGPCYLTLIFTNLSCESFDAKNSAEVSVFSLYLTGTALAKKATRRSRSVLSRISQNLNMNLTYRQIWILRETKGAIWSVKNNR